MAAEKTYELTYIINPVRNDDQIKSLVSRVSSHVEKNGGEVVEVDEWGNQRMAYPIEKKRSGYYVNMYFRAPGPMVSGLERTLEINDDVLRYLTLRLDKKMMRHYERRKSSRAEAEAAESASEDAAAEEKEAKDTENEKSQAEAE